MPMQTFKGGRVKPGRPAYLRDVWLQRTLSTAIKESQQRATDMERGN